MCRPDPELAEGEGSAFTSRRSSRLGILLSGRGSNFLVIADAIASGSLPHCEIVAVLANVEGAPGLDAARQRGIPAILQVSKGVPREEHDRNLLIHLQKYAVDYVILAGYMRVLTPAFVTTYPGRILNIHPSLLPSFPGLHAQRQALQAGATVAGCTVHLVDEQVDHGTILLQRSVPILPTDTEQTLSARILEQEHLAYPEAIRNLLSGKLK